MSLGKWFGFDRNEVYEEGLSAYARGAFEEAMDAFSGVLEHAAEPGVHRLARFYLAECHSKFGDAALRGERYEDAVASFEAALALCPDYPDFNLSAAKAWRGLGLKDKEKSYVGRSLGSNPAFAHAIAFEGLILYEDGMREEGLRRVQEACDIEPTLCADRFAIAIQQDKAGDHTRAAQTIFALSSFESNDANLHARLGDILARDQLFEEAIREYNTSLSIAPDYADVHCKLGQCLLEMGQLERAVVEFARATDLNGNYTEAYALMGSAYRQHGLLTEARGSVSRALELNPDHPLAVRERQLLA